MRGKISGSKAHRVWRCPAHVVLPQATRDEPHPMAGRGKAIHAFLENVKRIGADAALAAAPADLRPLLECLDLNDLPVHVATEVSFAYDWKNRTARELGRNIDRAYDKPGGLSSINVAELGPTEHAVTVDILGGGTVNGEKRGLVGDYKSGRTKYPAPDRFGQTLLGGLAARIVHGFDVVFLDLIYIDDDGENYRARRKVDEWDLDTFADEWQKANELVDLYEARLEGKGLVPDVVEGTHCDYCPAFKSCPAKLGLASRLPVVIEGLRVEMGQMTAARAGEAWLVLEAMSTLVNVMKGEIIGFASHGDIELRDGRVIGRTKHTKRSLDAKIAIPILWAKYGDEAVARAVKQSISMEALKDEVSARRAKGEKISTKNDDGVYDLMLRDIDKAGGLETTTTESIKPFVPKKLKP